MADAVVGVFVNANITIRGIVIYLHRNLEKYAILKNIFVKI